MTTPNEPTRGKNFVGSFLPWLVAISGLIFYLATLNHWFSLNNLTQVARVLGDLPGMDLYSPLYFLATYPLHWMPERLLPLSFNIFSALCAALTLGLLARSVALLPHDRTHQQRLREHGEFSLLSIRQAWLPPVLAALALGLQLTVWEGATTGTKEMLDLLVFAYVIRCVLEFRISERNSWLYRAALAYGAGITQNWVMIALLPAFLGALIWIRGISFFHLRFLRGLVLCGLAGLLLYLLLPLIYVNSEIQNGTFWQATKINLKAQKDVLYMLTHYVPGNILLLLSVTSLLPLLLIGIKWASHFGDPSPMGTALTTGVFHLSHGALLGACVWAAFDPAFGPRHVGGYPSLMLVLIYLATFCVGYFSGYFLLVFVPLKERSRNLPFSKTALHRASQTVMWSLLLLVPAGLIYKNLERINLANGPAISRFASQLVENLPERAVVLSDDPIRQLLAKSWLARQGRTHDRIFLATQNLISPIYFNEQQKLHPTDWLPPADPKNPRGVEPRTQIELLLKLSEQRAIYYLHPSFGYFFEPFCPVPHGLAIEMRRFATNSISPPLLTEKEISENETFWAGANSSLRGLIPFITEPPKLTHLTFRQTFQKGLHILFEPSPTALTLASYYSLALNTWGVHLEIADKLPEAGQCFDLALKLNSKNLPARRNQEFNRDLQAGIAPSVQPPKSLDEDFVNARVTQQYLRDGGPFDEPTHRFGQGVIFGQSSLNRQAAMQFERIAKLVPDYLPARIWLAQFYIMNRFPEKALALVPMIREQAEASADPGVTKYDILKVEANALFAANRFQEAEQRLREEMDKHPKDTTLLSLVFQISTSFKSYTNALHAVDLALGIKPGDIGALVNRGYISIQIADYPAAIAALTEALTADPNNTTAKMNRAIANLSGGRLEDAQQDYADLEKIAPNAFQIYYGLGDIAWRKKDTNNAIRYYDLYLANAPADTDEARTIADRLASLRTASP